MKTRFFVPGKPAPGGSKKGFYIKKINRVVITDASNKTKPWMDTVRNTARMEYGGPMFHGPLKVLMEFRVLRPKYHFGTGKNAGVVKPKYINEMPAKKPDCTKLLRSTEDALTGVMFLDDAQVCVQQNAKVYVERDPGVMITVMDRDDFNYDGEYSRK